MSNYISTLMKTAGVEPKYYYDVMLQDTIKSEEKFPLRSCTKKEVTSYCRDKKYYGYCKVNKVIKIFPPFTAEKQLEIIKLIANDSIPRDFCIRGKQYSGGKYALFQSNYYYSAEDNFSQALAQLTTKLMKAGGLDKSKVKEILE